MRQISLCLTTFNRYDLLIESFKHVLQCPEINEIIIVDDASEMDIFEKIKTFCEGIPKIKLHRNPTNLGMSLNKRKAVSLATNEWVALIDSDNKIDDSYFDSIAFFILDPKTIYAPCFARPGFDYRKFSNMTFDKSNICDLINDPMGNCAANTCNYIVSRDQYLEVYEHNKDVKETDTVWMLYLWLKAGNKIMIVPGMEYDHLQHSGSGWLTNADYNLKKGEETRQLILGL